MPTRPAALRIPISSLLASSSSPSSSTLNQEKENGNSQEYLPSSSYIVGELPPTSPIHLSVNYLDLIDDNPSDTQYRLPRNAQSSIGISDAKGKGKGKEKAIISDKDIDVDDNRNREGIPQTEEKDEEEEEKYIREIREKERCLIITGSKWNFNDTIKENDEDSFRNNSGYFEYMKKLKRIDLRYCPTPSHMELLLNLLTESDQRVIPSKGQQQQPQSLQSTPSLIILWDIASLFMYEENIDENEPPPQRTQKDDGMPLGEDEINDEDIDMNGESHSKVRKKFKPGVCISDYMDILSAIRATIDHLNTLHPSDPPTQLVILEPSLDPLSSLPILPPLSSENEDPKMPKSARERKINILDGVRWIFGKDSIGTIHQLSGDQNNSISTLFYSLTFDIDKNKSYQMKKKKCDKSEYSIPNFESQLNRPTGWKWEWVSS
ncbi:uncharacterized protein L201_004278 [Kwoniella dendrophila CBS 6074]|uniref:Uncharacterized protein n=1 Tax=Kwoniella dendrophila CBS 6074 TaxID=1295534 RepID=A0AAX4JV80_9TREE